MDSLALLTPYAAQVRLLQDRCAAQPRLKHRVEVSTVDAFQGREADVVIFSCVRHAFSFLDGWVGWVERGGE